MVGPWKFYIDSPQKRALHFCGASFDEGDGHGGGAPAIGWGDFYGDSDRLRGAGWGDGEDCGWGNGDGEGCGDDGYCAAYGAGDGDGWSASEW